MTLMRVVTNMIWGGMEAVVVMVVVVLRATPLGQDNYPDHQSSERAISQHYFNKNHIYT